MKYEPFKIRTSKSLGQFWTSLYNLTRLRVIHFGKKPYSFEHTAFLNFFFKIDRKSGDNIE